MPVFLPKAAFSRDQRYFQMKCAVLVLLLFDHTLEAEHTYSTVCFLPTSTRPQSSSVLQAHDLILYQNLEKTSWARQTHWLPPGQFIWQLYAPRLHMENRLMRKVRTGWGNALIWRIWPFVVYIKQAITSWNLCNEISSVSLFIPGMENL